MKYKRWIEIDTEGKIQKEREDVETVVEGEWEGTAVERGPERVGEQEMKVQQWRGGRSGKGGQREWGRRKGGSRTEGRS